MEIVITLFAIIMFVIMVGGAFFTLFYAMIKDFEEEIEIGVGEVFEFEGRKYKCIESFKLDKVNCHICAFFVIDCKYCLSECYHGYRKDGKEVYFVEVKE